jgi:hypothetical protein
VRKRRIETDISGQLTASDYMTCVCVTGPQEEALLGSAGTGWASSEELSDQASQAQHLEQLAQLCIVSKRYAEMNNVKGCFHCVLQYCM